MNNSNPSSGGSSGHVGGTNPGQTRNNPKEREEGGRGEGGVV